MKNINKFLSGCLLLVTSISLNAYADDSATLEFGPTTSKGYFFCTANDYATDSIVTIDTKNIIVRGFCPEMNNGDRSDVTSAGHISISADRLNKYNFEVSQDKFRSGKVIVVLKGKGTIKCNKNASASGRELYGAGSRFCLINTR